MLGGCDGNSSRLCRQSANAGPGLTAVSGFVKTFSSHGIRLKEFFDNVAVSVVEFPTQVSSCKRGEIAHAIDEKLCVSDAVFLFEFV